MPEWYRLGGEFFLGYGNWMGEYYVGMNLDYGGVSPTLVDNNVSIYGPAARRVIDFPNPEYNTWQSNNSGPIGDWPVGNPYQQFSIRFTRDVYIDDGLPGEDGMIPLRFFVDSDDGVRLWLLAEGEDAKTCWLDPAGDGSVTGTFSGDPTSFDNDFYGDDAPAPLNTGCLLINDWQNQGPGSTGTVVRTVPEGSYTIQLDYYENGGGAELRFDVSPLVNPDDAIIDGDPMGYTTVSEGANCNWGNVDRNNDANSLDYMWEEYTGGDIGRETLCYLELRGWVKIPDVGDPIHTTPIIEPQFVFWDVWDMDSSQAGWLEVAEYVPQDGTTNAIDRDATEWYRVTNVLRTGNTYNFNWTRNVLDLSNLSVVDSAGNPQTLDLKGSNVTFRFAFANGETDWWRTRRWYVDDIQIIDRIGTDFSDQYIGLDTHYKFNDMGMTESQYFITSPLWEMTGNYTAPDPDSGALGGFAWELNPDGDYTEFSESPWSNAGTAPYEDMRIHYIHLTQTIDINLSSVDEDGDTGDPVLTFWHGYDLDRYVGLEVQYRAEGSDEWIVVPGASPADPAGRIISVANSDNSIYRDRQTLQPETVELKYIRDSLDQPMPRYQLRFAMIVHRRSDTRDGWFIDNIKLHREDRDRFLDYPLTDDAESGVIQWLATGEWSRTTERSYEGAHSFTDSPNKNYETNTGGTLDGNHLRFVYPIDLNNDTPSNLILTDRNPAGGNTAAAIRPVLSFWHRRMMSSGDNFHVEWRLQSEDDSQWKGLWIYQDRMEYEAGDRDDSTRENEHWEYVHVDLTPIMDTFLSPGEPGYDAAHPPDTDPLYNPDDTTYRDDDILLRFRLYSDGSNTNEGVYIDNIRLEEYSERSYRLWRNDPTIGGENFGTGNNITFVSDLENNEWFRDWRLNGTWERIDWEQQNGLFAFHNSTFSDENGEQTEAPYFEEDPPATYPTKGNTYDVVELTRIIDMRATDIRTLPTMYFWTRYDLGERDRLRVDISYELIQGTDYTGSLADYMESDRCNNINRSQCYEQNWGWSQWYQADFFGPDNWDEDFGWRRKQIDLSVINGVDLAADFNADVPGRRVRVRFVYDAMDTRDNRSKDGWYIDNISIGPRNDDVLANIGAGGVFFDDASNMVNWVGEGLWGLSPSISLSDELGVATLGVWQEFWWYCPDCDRLTGIPSSLGGADEFAYGADLFLQRDGDFDENGTIDAGFPETPVTRTVLDITYDIGRGSPRPDGAFDEENEIIGRWVLDTPAIRPENGIQPGTYSFITTSDNGVRMRWEELDAAGNVIGPPGAPWNIINNWSPHGRTVDIPVDPVELIEDRRYRFTIEFYEDFGDATMILAIGGSSFSFTDSPRQGTGASFPDVEPIPYTNTSMILDGVIDLTGTTNPIWQYYTVYELRCGSDARAEASNDGGFSWGQSGFNNSIDLGGGLEDDNFDDGNWSGVRLEDDEDGWRLQRHNLTNYRGQQVVLRFRLDRGDETEMSGDRTCDPNRSDYNQNNRWIGVWIADVQVGE